MARPVALDLRGRVVLVTGGARGIGLDIAQRAAAKGARVALLDVDGEGAERAAAALGAPVAAAAFAVDVTDAEGLAAAVDAVAERFGGIDVVVANAGVAPPPGTVLSVAPEPWERVVEVNLTGVYRTVKLTLPHVVAGRGHVLLVASVMAFANGVLTSPYAVAKAGVEALGRALRVELAPHGASAGVAYFGFIDTQLVRETFAREPYSTMREWLPAFAGRALPVGRAGAAAVRGIERRAPRVTVPRYVPVMSALRGVLPWLVDERMCRDDRLADLLRRADAGVAPPKLTQASSSR